MAKNKDKLYVLKWADGTIEVFADKDEAAMYYGERGSDDEYFYASEEGKYLAPRTILNRAASHGLASDWPLCWTRKAVRKAFKGK